MRLEKQICNLEQAKKLTALGVTASALFSWIDTTQIEFAAHTTPFICETARISGSINSSNASDKEQIKANTLPAYTVSELGFMLPASFTSFGSMEDNELACIKEANDSWTVKYEYSTVYAGYVPGKATRILTAGRTEADARANMLIELIECGVISADRVNTII